MYSILSFRTLAILTTLLALTSQAGAATCQAEVTLNSTYPSHAFYLYHDIIVENTGDCDITEVFVQITLPPGSGTAFEYHNITEESGLLTGLIVPMRQGSVQTGGTIVLNSARIPAVSLGSVTCASTCNSAGTPTTPPSPPSPPSTPNPSLQLALRSGANRNWFAFNVIANGTDVPMKAVELRDAGYYTAWQLMTQVVADTIPPTYTFTPRYGPLTLPLSVRMTTATTEPIMVVVMRDFITAFADGVLDTEVEYPPSAPAL